MTTYSFVDQEFTMTKIGANAYLQGDTVYTVPSGKIAKIQFDSFHLSQSSDNTFNLHNFTLYSQGTNIIRKHFFGDYNFSNGDISSIHYYDTNNFAQTPNNNGNAAERYAYTHSAQSQDWSRNGTVNTSPDSNVQLANFIGSGQGNRSNGPSYWYMDAGEVLKVISRCEFPATIAGNLYTNIRLMVFLEDS